MDQQIVRRIGSSVLLSVVGACGGGGGGGSGPSAIEVPFSSFAAIAPNQRVVANGVAVTASGDQTTVGSNTTITSANLSAIGSGTVRLTYDGSRALSAITASTPQSISDVSFNSSTPGHSISCSGATCLAENATSSAAFMDAHFLGWNYQTFGVWGKDLSATSWTFGAASVGRITPGNAVPTTTGTVNFAGLAAGFYVDPSGTPFATASPINLGVNFGQQTVQYTTVETRLVNANTQQQTMDPQLNLSGTLSYGQGSSTFSGTLQTPSGTNQMSGPASGNFYGPSAEEIGGVYRLSGSGVSRMVGAFGGKR